MFDDEEVKEGDDPEFNGAVSDDADDAFDDSDIPLEGDEDSVETEEEEEDGGPAADL